MSVAIGPVPQGKAAPEVAGTQVKRAAVDQKHPDWELHCETWLNTSIMYEGEPLISKNAERFLKRRPKEDSALFQHRMDLFTYDNHLATGLGYYEAQMFDVDPKINITQKDPTTGEPKPASEANLSPDQTAFYSQCFLKNADRAGTPFIEMWQRVYQYMLLFGKAWELTDLPTQPTGQQAPTNLKEQMDNHLLDPYKVLYTPMDVINWECDSNGNLNWAVVFVSIQQQPFLGKPTVIDRWTYYDRQEYRVYEQTYEKGQGVSSSIQDKGDAPVNLVGAGYHAMHAQNKVPLQQISVPQSWWLARRAYSPAKAQINTSNSLRWALQMAALAVPVLFTTKEVAQISISEAGVIVLEPGDRYEYAEPEGKSWQELRAEAVGLKEDIFRSMYLVAMARDTNATASAQSGVSKQQDMAPSHVVLSGMGAVLRSAMQESLQRVIDVRSTLPGYQADAALVPDVRGFEFEDKLTVEEIDVIQTVLGLEIPSDRLEKEIFKTAARVFLKNSNPEIMQAIAEEIDAAPSKEERDQAQMEQRANMLRQGIASRLKDPVAGEESN